MKAFYQLCVLIGLVMQTHSGPISAGSGKEEKVYALKVTANDDILEVVRESHGDVLSAPYAAAAGDNKWLTNQLTYRIENYTPDMPQAKVDYSIERAFQVWADVTPLRFTRIYNGMADIMIKFAIGDHGDGSPFRGTNDFVAHAFGPYAHSAIGGDIHFNDDFTFSSSQEHNLFLVAAHEIGHSLGLMHAKDPGALMNEFYSYRNVKKFILPRNDVDAIQSLYGPNPDKPVDPEKPEPTHPVTPDACDPNLVLDAVSMLRGEIFFFKKGLFWRTQPFSQVTTQHLIKTFWPEAPEHIDAAYEDPSDDKVYLFKGQKIWAFDGYDIVKGYPKSLESMGLPAKVKRITAALYNSESGKTLLFNGKQYYSYDSIKKKLDKGYPKPVHHRFPGMASKVTAAFQYQGYTYLYSGSYMFEYDAGVGKLMRLLDNNYFLNC